MFILFVIYIIAGILYCANASRLTWNILCDVIGRPREDLIALVVLLWPIIICVVLIGVSK